MKINEAVTALSALAQETRLNIYRYLIQKGEQGVPAGEMSDFLQIPPATLSFHLKTLKQAGLITCQRKSRSLIYIADYQVMNALISYLTTHCCSEVATLCQIPVCKENTLITQETTLISQESLMNTQKTYNVLFLCTGNSVRSIIAESLMNYWGKNQFCGYSAGSYPKGEVHPLSLKLLKRLGMPTEGLRSKSWDEFVQVDAPLIDFVFTVCDKVAAKTCPIWPGQPLTAHWGVPDPAAIEGNEVEKMLAFRQTFQALENRIKIFVNLPVAALDRLKLKQKLDEIGQTEIEDNS